MPDPKPPRDPDTDPRFPTFKVSIMKCAFRKLTMQQLTEKLTLLHKIGFTKYFTVSEDTDEEMPKE